MNSPQQGHAGWHSDLKTFISTYPNDVQLSLESFVDGVSVQQANAWRETIPMIQKEGEELIQARTLAHEYGTLLEYRLPYELRRPDVIVLAEGTVVVLELKGKTTPNQADLDQVASYARDLRAYHRQCADREVFAVLVPTRSKGSASSINGVHIVSPDKIDELINEFVSRSQSPGPTIQSFLDFEAYRPLPTLVEAARELFHSRTIREIWRAQAATDPAVDTIFEIVKEAARTNTRHLVLISGIPGSGKTLVGMRSVHSKLLDELSSVRGEEKPTVPGLYLTGNGPLSEVLQYQLRKDGAGGQTFVRHIKAYLDRYVPNPGVTPQEHLLVFDEAQRAFSPEKVADTHRDWPHSLIASEPNLFVKICDRMPDWAVLIGLVGSGQEIHVGEEEGLSQWSQALDQSKESWTVHTPTQLGSVFVGGNAQIILEDSLNLDVELRFHSAKHIHSFVEEILSQSGPKGASDLASEIMAPNGQPVDGTRIYVTRNLDVAKEYLIDRYQEYQKARYGILASSRDKDLSKFGIANDWQSTRRVRIGPWFTEDETSPQSCRLLKDVVTEFGCQGLELDMVLLAWGTDLMREHGQWSIRNSKKYLNRGSTSVSDPMQLRVNAYRVLLTRGRDGTVIFVPPITELDETYKYLMDCGIPVLFGRHE